MANSTDDHSNRIDELFATIRTALASNASSNDKTSAAQACRTILNGLEPAPSPRNGSAVSASSPPSSPAAMFAGTPIGEALNVLGAIPREQLVRYVMSGVQSLFSQSAPTYKRKPAAAPAQDSGERS